MPAVEQLLFQNLLSTYLSVLDSVHQFLHRCEESDPDNRTDGSHHQSWPWKGCNTRVHQKVPQPFLPCQCWISGTSKTSLKSPTGTCRNLQLNLLADSGRLPKPKAQVLAVKLRWHSAIALEFKDNFKISSTSELHLGFCFKSQIHNNLNHVSELLFWIKTSGSDNTVPGSVSLMASFGLFVRKKIFARLFHRSLWKRCAVSQWWCACCEGWK